MKNESSFFTIYKMPFGVEVATSVAEEMSFMNEVVTQVWFLEPAHKGHTLSWVGGPLCGAREGSVICLLIGGLIEGPVQ